MSNKELKEYLNMFPDDAVFGVLIANPKERKLYPVENLLGGIIDAGHPILCIEVGHELDMDSEMIAACEEDEREAQQLAGQMDITDFPEVLP